MHICQLRISKSMHFCSYHWSCCPYYSARLITVLQLSTPIITHHAVPIQ
jgi:hypothetical protein